METIVFSLPLAFTSIRPLPQGVELGLAWTYDVTIPEGIIDLFWKPTLDGETPYNMTARLRNEIVGGRCILHVSLFGVPDYRMPFFIRGKNPLDATVRDYIDATVPNETLNYAYWVALHESKNGNRIYNQFNPEDVLTGRPYKGGGNSNNGWGVAQIDRGRNPGCSTAEVYDWKVNIRAMANKLSSAANDTTRFIEYYRSAYGGSVNWIEPPSTNINGVTVTGRMWSILTLYNGAGDIVWQTTPTHLSPPFKSPLQFDSNSGRWIFRHDSRNEHYVQRVINDRTTVGVE